LLPILYYALPQRIVRAVLHEDPYPVRAIYLQGGNLLTAYTNARETYNALMKLNFFVAADLFMTPTTLLADIVLPAATYLEFDSVEVAPLYPVASVQQKVIHVGECWPDGKILNELSKRMGFKEYIWTDMTEPLNILLEAAGITFDEFRKIGFIAGEKVYRHFKREGFQTPSRRVELYSKRLEAWGFEPLPIYHEPPETLYSEPEMAQEYPFILTSGKTDVYRQSGGRQILSLRKERPEPLIKMGPETAKRLRIEEGERVSIYTKRGKIKQKVNIIEGLDPRVVEIDYAWWFPENAPSSFYDWDVSNINILTDDQPPTVVKSVLRV
jgi:anaerobic selenocysteine-containing dehydrogenase